MTIAVMHVNAKQRQEAEAVRRQLYDEQLIRLEQLIASSVNARKATWDKVLNHIPSVQRLTEPPHEQLDYLSVRFRIYFSKKDPNINWKRLKRRFR